MKVEQEFVSADIALKLKDLGFDKDCFGYYNIDPQLSAPYFNFGKPFSHEWCLPAPLYQQAFRWFNINHNLEHTIEWNKFYEQYPYQYTVRKQWIDEPLVPRGISGMCKTYEEAENTCLQKMIEFIKESKL